ncbi:MAG TPA: dienelactone hydrolase family protein [Candidatus Limnocylindria bacterium]|nr:dienelactone hydrolase family protein [Candidatus Limnocylindria bacterium]
MTIKEDGFVDLPTPTGPMRTYVFRPQAEGRYPGILLYSEIFQVTGPIRRTAAMLAGHGYVVAVPEIWHEFEPAGCVLGYDQAGADRGNALKLEKELHGLDGDARAALGFLKSHPNSTGKLGVAGICIGGHLSFRAAAKNSDVLAAVGFYATDIHKGSLSKTGDDTLALAKDIQGDLLLLWGRQDPHVPLDGRKKIYNALNEMNVNFTWHEFNGQHAFMRDEGHRYDPALALLCYQMTLELFHRKLGEGDLPAQKPAGPAESKH